MRSTLLLHQGYGSLISNKFYIPHGRKIGHHEPPSTLAVRHFEGGVPGLRNPTAWLCNTSLLLISFEYFAWYVIPWEETGMPRAMRYQARQISAGLANTGWRYSPGRPVMDDVRRHNERQGTHWLSYGTAHMTWKHVLDMHFHASD